MDDAEGKETTMSNINEMFNATENNETTAKFHSIIYIELRK